MKTFATTTWRELVRAVFGPGLAGHIAAAAAGALITLALAPFDIPLADILGLALLQRLLESLPPRAAALRGWWFGAGLFLSGASWVYVSIHDYGYAPVPLALLLTLIFCLGQALVYALFGYAYARWLRELPGGRWLGFAALWALSEWLRSWLLTGFPWVYAGYAHIDDPLGGWAPVAGVFGLGLAAALSGATVALLLRWPQRQQRSLPAPLLLTALLWLGGGALQDVAWVRPLGAPVSVALVQANIPQSVKWDEARYQATLDTYTELSAPYWAQAQIVVWSEAAVPAYYDLAWDFLEAQAQTAASHGHTLITGVPYREPAADGGPHYAIYNSAVALGDGGGLYHKQHLVPFGEYVPLQHWLRGLIRFFDMPMSNFRAGPAGQTPLHAGAITLAPSICYEIVYPDLVRESRADVLITLSNDGWFGRSIGPLQHLQMAQMRALENGRQLIRATGNGVTALIDEHGRIQARAPQFEATVLTGTVQPLRGLTPFARTGSAPVVVLCFALLAGCALAGWRQRRAVAATPAR